MQDKELYGKILGIEGPWLVTSVNLDLAHQQVVVRVERDPAAPLTCPECGEPCAGYDHKPRRWRHLDTCQLQTILEVDVPRANCATHGIHLIKVPWGEAGSRFTAMFEAMVIGWLKVASITAVSNLVGLTWDEVDGIMERAVRRGLERREVQPIAHVAVDETSFQKRHEYVTVVLDRERNVVVDVLDDRTRETLETWLSSRPPGHADAIETITMDMWRPFINAILEVIPGAEQKICFDRFHIAGHFSKALDVIRADEHREMRRLHGRSPLLRTKHQWLRSASNIDNRSRRSFMALTRTKLRTARAWAIKEAASSLWSYARRGSAANAWGHLLQWIARCRLEPVVKVGRLVREHLWGILNAIVAKASNAIAESRNAGIQKLKSRACGFRSRERFRRSILFHFGGLDLMPKRPSFG